MASVIVRGDIDRNALEAARVSGRVAWDIETTGLSFVDDAIATCQIAIDGHGTLLIQIEPDSMPPNLIALLGDETVLKVFHHAPFDLAFMRHKWSAVARRISCTKIASKLAHDGVPNSSHSLQSLLRSELNIQIDKGERQSDWTRRSLTSSQVQYATNDVRYLLELYAVLRKEVALQNKDTIYEKCCAFLPTYVELKISGKEAIFDY